jgi:hypothetical protein
MAEASQFTLPYKELAEVLVKHLDIHEGFWSIFLKFGIQATNMSLNNAPYAPTAIVPVLEIGINREAELMPLAVDAAEVNPLVRRRSGGRRATAKRKVAAKKAKK